MSSIANAFRRLLPARMSKGFAGYDLQGNSYFELPNPAGGRMKRSVEYKVSRELSEYGRGEHRPPIQWRAWLAHTRAQPPTMDELQIDHQRQMALQPKIAAIELREREERIRQGYLLPDGSLPEVPKEIAGPSTPTERRARVDRISQSQASSTPPTEYPVPTPPQADLAPPRETIDPSTHASAVDLRKLAEEDTKRRIEQSQRLGVQVPGEEQSSSSSDKTPGQGGGLQPRRRARK